jgi:hypothetical protein
MRSCRTDRDLARGRRAAVGVRAAGGSALQAAFAHIEATFSPAIRHSTFKDRVAALIRAGAAPHPVANLETAIILAERMRRAELEARANAIHTWGHCSRPRLTLMVLDELRLILRMVRRYAPSRYPSLIATVLGADIASRGRAIISVEAAE